MAGQRGSAAGAGAEFVDQGVAGRAETRAVEEQALVDLTEHVGDLVVGDRLTGTLLELGADLRQIALAIAEAEQNRDKRRNEHRVRSDSGRVSHVQHLTGRFLNPLHLQRAQSRAIELKPPHVLLHYESGPLGYIIAECYLLWMGAQRKVRSAARPMTPDLSRDRARQGRVLAETVAHSNTARTGHGLG